MKGKAFAYGRGSSGFNTFIGGVSATISTASLLATKLGISVARIENFTIDGSDIKCKITGSYDIPNNCFRNPVLGITYYDDRDGLVNVLNSECFGGSYGETALTWVNFSNVTTVIQSFNFTPNLKIIELPKATSITGESFGNCEKKTIYAPLCTTLGSSNLNNYVFKTITGNPTIYVNPLLQTNNSGAADGDLQYAISRGATVIYVTNFTAPNPVTTLSTGTVYNTAVQLNFTPPSSTNAIDYYECYADGILKNRISASGDYITGLTPSTSYGNITVIAVDLFYNKSVVSNSVSATTDVTGVPLYRLVSYYKLDSNSNDSYGSNNGTDTSVSYVSGKVGNAGSFNGSSSNISIADNSNLSFTNGSGTDTPFSFSFWLKLNNQTDQWLVNKRGGSSGTDEYQITYYQGKLRLWLFSSNNANYLACEMTSALLSATQYYITATYDGSEAAAGLKIYINGVLQTTNNSMAGTYTGMPNGTAPLTIGKAGWFSGFYLNGQLDEVAVYNTALTQTEIDLLYNSGNGITL